MATADWSRRRDGIDLQRLDVPNPHPPVPTPDQDLVHVRARMDHHARFEPFRKLDLALELGRSDVEHLERGRRGREGEEVVAEDENLGDLARSHRGGGVRGEEFATDVTVYGGSGRGKDVVPMNSQAGDG